MARLACLPHGLAATTPRWRGEVYATPVITLLFGCTRGLPAAARGDAGPGQPVPRLPGPGLSPQDNRVLFESVARLNAAEPSQVGRSGRGAIRRRTAPAPRPYSGCSTRAAWPASWCGTTSSSPDGSRVATTTSPGAASRVGNGRPRADRARGAPQGLKTTPPLTAPIKFNPADRLVSSVCGEGLGFATPWWCSSDHPSGPPSDALGILNTVLGLPTKDKRIRSHHH